MRRRNKYKMIGRSCPLLNHKREFPISCTQRRTENTYCIHRLHLSLLFRSMGIFCVCLNVLDGKVDYVSSPCIWRLWKRPCKATRSFSKLTIGLSPRKRRTTLFVDWDRSKFTLVFILVEAFIHRIKANKIDRKISTYGVSFAGNSFFKPEWAIQNGGP